MNPFAGIMKWIPSLYPLVLLLCGCAAQLKTSGPFAVAVDINPELDIDSLHRSYQDGSSKDYLAISGSQVNQDLILGGFERFVTWQRGALPSYRLRDNFTALGYFQQNTTQAVSELCDRNRKFLALAAALRRDKPVDDIQCKNGDLIRAIPLGHDAKVFAVSARNSFAQSINLEVLAKASRQANGALRWSDLNPDWPARPVRWVFPVQLPFTTHMKRLGIELPKKFLLATNYTGIFNSGYEDPDVLIFTYFSPSLNAQLKGSRFRLLPVQAGKDLPVVMPTPLTINVNYPETLKTDIVMYINRGREDSCIAMAFAGFLLNFNQPILLEYNMAPLDAVERKRQLDRLDKIFNSTSSSTTIFCQRTWPVMSPSGQVGAAF